MLSFIFILNLCRGCKCAFLQTVVMSLMDFKFDNEDNLSIILGTKIFVARDMIAEDFNSTPLSHSLSEQLITKYNKIIQ